jgi:hypothetical protein
VDRGQPVTFLPGRHADVFTTDFNGDSLTWRVTTPNAGAASETASWWFHQACVSIDLLAKPDVTTESTTAKFSWVALVSGYEYIPQALRGNGTTARPMLFSWTDWRRPECILDDVAVDCAAQPEATFTGLGVGEHTFTVEATGPRWCSHNAGPGCMALGRTTRGGDANDKLAGASHTWTVKAPAPTITTSPPVVQQQQQQQQPQPTPRSCASRRGFTIRIRERRARPILRASVKVNGKRVKVMRRNGRLTARVGLAALPKGRFSARIAVRYRDGGRRTYTRRYRTCDAKLKPSNDLASKNAL